METRRIQIFASTPILRDMSPFLHLLVAIDHTHPNPDGRNFGVLSEEENVGYLSYPGV